MLVSIGYSSCHWCHVMERESFEDPDTARLMNEHLVCIKVDREERPDVDQIYMDTVVRLTGSGGWPLNVFCTPDGRPFWGGTYFPPEESFGRPSWSDVVRSIARLYGERPADVETQAQRLLEVLGAGPTPGREAPRGREGLRRATADLLRRGDAVHGGFGGAPKFPTPTNLEALLLAHEIGAAAPGAQEHVLLTLRRMAKGGIYDQIGGGFHRYSVDDEWRVPHFEKMLYDQGQLLRVYAEAYRQTGDPDLAWPVEETVRFLEREMSAPDGGFYASLDADSEGEEGRYYVWTASQVLDALGQEAGRRFCEAYGLEAGGDPARARAAVLTHGLAGERARFEDSRRRLLEARKSRVAPGTDTKRIASWIGYTISGLASAGGVLGRAEWIARAERAAGFVVDVLLGPDGRLHRVRYDGATRIRGFLDDHAAVLAGLLDLHRAGGADSWITVAVRLADEMVGRFYDPATRDLYFVPSDTDDLITRPSTDLDGATPSAAGLAALGLLRLATITGRTDLLAVADAVVERWWGAVEASPAAFPTLLRAAALRETGPGVALIVGEREDGRTGALAARARTLLPTDDAVVPVSPGAPPGWLDPAWLEGRAAGPHGPAGYVCRGSVCSLPAGDPADLALPPVGSGMP